MRNTSRAKCVGGRRRRDLRRTPGGLAAHAKATCRAPGGDTLRALGDTLHATSRYAKVPPSGRRRSDTRQSAPRRQTSCIAGTQLTAVRHLKPAKRTAGCARGDTAHAGSVLHTAGRLAERAGPADRTRPVDTPHTPEWHVAPASLGPRRWRFGQSVCAAFYDGGTVGHGRTAGHVAGWRGPRNQAAASGLRSGVNREDPPSRALPTTTCGGWISIREAPRGGGIAQTPHLMDPARPLDARLRQPARPPRFNR